MPATIFVIDSSPAVRRMVEEISAPEGYRVVGFQDGPTALESARKLSPALIIADFHLENMTFSGFCKEIGQQDNLAETLIVSLLDASDRLDESKLRSLGVRAFLKKPFQSEQLLDTVKGILNDAAAQQRGKKPAKSRTWPPASTAIGEEDDGIPQDASIDDAPASDETEKEQTTMPPAQTQSTAPSTPPATSGFGGEEMMKGLFDHLLQSVALQADRKINDLLPSAIAREVTGQVNTVRAAVREETAKQLAEALSQDRLQKMVREVLQEELSRQTATQLAAVETAVRQAVSDLAPPLVEQSAERLLRGLAETEVKKHLPEALQGQQETITELVKREVERAAVSHARQTAEKAEEIVREMAQDPIRQVVQRIVPDLAETQVREEIKRLSSPD